MRAALKVAMVAEEREPSPSCNKSAGRAPQRRSRWRRRCVSPQGPTPVARSQAAPRWAVRRRSETAASTQPSRAPQSTQPGSEGPLPPDPCLTVGSMPVREGAEVAMLAATRAALVGTQEPAREHSTCAGRARLRRWRLGRCHHHQRRHRSPPQTPSRTPSPVIIALHTIRRDASTSSSSSPRRPIECCYQTVGSRMARGATGVAVRMAVRVAAVMARVRGAVTSVASVIQG